MNGLKSPEEILLKHIPRIPDYVKPNLFKAMKEYASQFTPVIGESGEEEKTVSIEEYDNAMNEIAQLQEQLKQAEDQIIELSKFLDGPE